MLILTRRVGERVMIGSDVVVAVLGIKGAQVRLGIHAPKDVAVDREELREKKDQDLRSTTTPSATPKPGAASPP